MSTPIAAIPTTYRGIRMRSRLEAKWAAMFDLMGWKWEYEAIDLNGWIPDFLITNTVKPTLVEIKPIYNVEKSYFPGYYLCPEDISLKIERALKAPLKGSCEDWDKFWNSFEYNVVIFGGTIEFVWQYIPDNGWYHYKNFKRTIIPNLSSDNWIKATNQVQWNRV